MVQGCQDRVDSNHCQEQIATDSDQSLRFDILDEQYHNGLGQANHQLEEDVAGIGELSRCQS